MIEFIIDTLNKECKQTDDNRLKINNKKVKTGHGAIFIGYPDSSVRILVGNHFENNKLFGETGFNLNFFGGGSDNCEPVLETVIREVLEEVFNINPLEKYVKSILEYLCSPLVINKYHIFANKKNSYSYVFNIKILTDIVRILCGLSKEVLIKLPINSIKYKSINLCNYYKNSEFNLKNFLKDREIPSPKKVKFHSLNEIKYISYPRLSELIKNDTDYNIVNFNTGLRSKINYSKFMKNFIKKSLLKEINNISQKK
jgi:hypothetical protein